MKKEKKDRPVRVLQVCLCGDGNFGGLEHFLYGYCSHIDAKAVTFDYLYLNRRPGNAGGFDEILEHTNVYELDVWKSIHNPIKRYFLMFWKTRAVVKKGQYDAIHINTGVIYIAMLIAYIAKKEDIPIRIVHAHAIHAPEKNISKICTKLFGGLMQKSIGKNSTHQFTCSDRAGKSMFGSTKQLKNYRIIKNAIEVGQFRYAPETRKRIRENMGAVNDKIVITVGNLLPVKNHSFLIDVFRTVLENDASAKLWIVGGGELKDALQAQIDSLGLSGHVVLFGVRNNVDELLQAADLYVCPSLSEGLSLSIVEAQTSGLRVLASDGISREHRITDLVEFFPLNAGRNQWALEILRMLNEKYIRKDRYQEMADAGYEINVAAKQLENFYVLSVKEPFFQVV